MSSKVVLKKIEDNDLYVWLKPSNATYRFANVPEDVQDTFNQMLEDGGELDALQYLRDSVGKGVRVGESADSKRLLNRILAGENVEDVLGKGTQD